MRHSLPLVPLKNMVVFPEMIVPVFVGRPKSLQSVKMAQESHKPLVFCLQKTHDEVVGADSLHPIGVLCEIIQFSQIDQTNYKLLIQARERVSVTLTSQDSDDYYFCDAQIQQDVWDFSSEVEQQQSVQQLIELLRLYLSINRALPTEVLNQIIEEKDGLRLSYSILHFLMFPIADKQELLEINSVKTRLHKLHELLYREIDLLKVDDRLHSAIKARIDRSQKEFYLKEKMKAIQAELGETMGLELDDTAEYERRLEGLICPNEVKTKTLRELSKLRKLSSMSAESGLIKTYLEWILDMPWEKSQSHIFRLDSAQAQFDIRHYGLKKVKERIVEFLAVYKATGQIQGTILCLCGPSGVGKTSIARSIAEVMGRPFVTVSCGGMNDEAELRGHRRTYVGAMPGRIVQAIRQAGVNNPVVLLDEVDKLTKNAQSNPAAVLLEMLDPEQNKDFYDYFLELPFDLSRVIFIATANTTYDIPRAVLDRMEVIRLSGYTTQEKLVIAKQYLLPKVCEKHGLSPQESQLDDELLTEMILNYTREAGVRELGRCLAAFARKKVVHKMSQLDGSAIVEMSLSLTDILGHPKYFQSQLPQKPTPGIVLGLAYTEHGGDVLPVEVMTFPGKGQLYLTGKMGEVMQESARAALSFIRSIAKRLELPKGYYDLTDVHIHLPENAIPKDGPSAGVAICVALISAYTKIPLSNHLAMTGELTLHGQILPVGGVREKLLAAERMGVERVYIPKDNWEDYQEVKAELGRPIQVEAVSSIFDLLVPLGFVRKWLN